jgi:hypothetical protein
MGLLSIVFLLGGMTLITPLGNEAEASGRVTPQDLHQDHKKIGKSVEKIEEQLGDAAPPCGAGTARQRLVVSPDGTEVCDNTTGLNWEQNPDSIIRNQVDALAHCSTLGPGYRLPEVKELISLVDYSVAGRGPVLPVGHPFSNVGPDADYWSATENTFFRNTWWIVDFDFGNVFSNPGTNHVWCVR